MTVRKALCTSVLISILGAGASAWSLGKVRFGPEFTFYHPDQKDPDAKPYLDRLEKHLIYGQPKLAKFTRKVRPCDEQFISPNGWNFSVERDKGVIEVKTLPMTVTEFKKFKDDMQDAIFVSAANEGFFPALYLGGGHVNLDAAAFEGNDLLLRNFIVDLYNHNELFMGVFNYDTANAIPVNLLPKATKALFTERVDEFGVDGTPSYVFDQTYMLQDLHNIQFDAPEVFLKAWQRPKDGFKQAAMNFANVSPSLSSRIELRGFRPQASMDVWIRQIELIEARLKYLEKITTPIPIKERVVIEPLDVRNKQHHLNPPVDTQAALRSFYMYVKESGLKWRDHSDYLWPKWITDGEVERFESSSWFRARQKETCEADLVN